jgi:hypothetical protein
MYFRTIQSFTDGRAIVPVDWDEYFNNADINSGYSRNNLWLIDPSDPLENIAENISDKEKQYIHSQAINGVNNMHNNKYEFLYK